MAHFKIAGALAGAILLASGHVAHADHHDEHKDHASHADSEAGMDSTAAIHHRPEGALEAYRDALIAQDIEAAGAVFAEDSLVFENGKAEGNWANYAENHLGPELGYFSSFEFPAYEIEIEMAGHYALGVERYTYRIELTNGRIVERAGVATSVLRHGADGWKIIRYHSS